MAASQVGPILEDRSFNSKLLAAFLWQHQNEQKWGHMWVPSKLIKVKFESWLFYPLTICILTFVNYLCAWCFLKTSHEFHKARGFKPFNFNSLAIMKNLWVLQNVWLLVCQQSRTKQDREDVGPETKYPQLDRAFARIFVFISVFEDSSYYVYRGSMPIYHVDLVL